MVPACNMGEQLCQPRRTKLPAHFLRACCIIHRMVTKQKHVSRKSFNCNLYRHFQHQPAKRQETHLSPQLTFSPRFPLYLPCSPNHQTQEPVNPLQAAMLSTTWHKTHVWHFRHVAPKATPCHPSPDIFRYRDARPCLWMRKVPSRPQVQTDS